MIIGSSYVIQAEINVNGNANSDQWGTVSKSFDDIVEAETVYERMRDAIPEQAYRLVFTQHHVARSGKGRVYS